MANTLRAKRRAAGGAAGAPASLATTELAYNEVDDTFYLGFGDNGSGVATSIVAIAGKGAFASLSTAQTISGAKDFSAVPTVSAALSTADNSTKVATTAFVVGQGYQNAAAVQAMVDAAVQGFSWKQPVRVMMTSNVVLTAPGTTLDGVTMAVGDRVALTAQTTGSQNGIYVYQGSAATMTRALDADAAAEFKGMAFTVMEGTLADRQYLQTVDAFTLGTTTAVFAQVGSSAGGVTSVVSNGTGAAVAMNVTGSTLNNRSIIGQAAGAPGKGITVTQNTSDLTFTLNGVESLAGGGTGADLSGVADGTLFKKSGTGLVAAVAGTDYLSPSSTISGGTF